MNLDEYEKIAHLICWPQFTEKQEEVRQEEFDSLYKRKYGEYQTTKRSIRAHISRGAKEARFEGEITEMEVTEEEHHEPMEVDPGESPITYIRKQLENLESVPLSDLVPSNEYVFEEEEGVLQATPSTSNRSATVPAPSVTMKESVEEVSLQPTPPANRSAYEMTEEKIFLPSTEENYNVDDLSSNDETDDEEHPRKTVPSWAQSVGVTMKVLSTIVSEEQVQHHFGQIAPPTVESLFKSVKRYKRRVSDNSDDSLMWEP